MLKKLFVRSQSGGGGALDPDSAYSLWAPSYPPRPHNQLMEVEQAAMLALLPDVSGKRVLDAGCGTGRYLELLRQRNARAIGVDRSQAMLSRVARPVALVRGHLQALPFEAASLDAIVCALALGDIADLPAAIVEFARILRPGGHLLYSVVHPDGGRAGWTRSFDTPDGERHVASYWHSRVEHERALLASGFSIAALREPAISGRGVALVLKARKVAANL